MLNGLLDHLEEKNMRKRKAKQIPKEKTRLEKRTIPKSEIDMDTELNVTLSTVAKYRKNQVEILPSQTFQETPAKDQVHLFLEKCQQCSVVCDFSNPDADIKSKKVKTQLLKDITSAFAFPFLLRALTPDHLSAFYKMLSKNLFRPFPDICHRPTALDFHDSFFDSSWLHLQLAYEALSASFHSQQTSTMSAIFIYKLVRNCVSPDSRERVVVRDTLHALYTKYMCHRDIIRQMIALHFLDGICSAELLEFLKSVADGFNSPLKPNHVNYFLKYVLPLHTLPNYHTFFTNLSQCTVTFIQKSGPLFDPTVSYLLKHWPQSNRPKEVLFLKELETVMCTFQFQITSDSLASISRQFANMINDANVDIVETVYDIILNPKLQTLFKGNSALIYLILVPSIKETQNSHWDEIVRFNAVAIIQYLAELDRSALLKAEELTKLSSTKATATFGVVKTNWMRIAEVAKIYNPRIELMEGNLESLRT